MNGKRHPYVLFACGYAVLLFVFYALSGVVLYRYGDKKKDFGWDYASDSSGRYVRIVDPKGPAAGALLPGDRLLAINGDDRIQRGPSRFGTVRLKRSTVAPGESYTIRFSRQETIHRAALRTVVSPDTRRLWRSLPVVLVSLLFTISGAFVGLVKPEDRLARLVSLTCLLGGTGLLGLALTPLNDFIRGGWMMVHQLSYALLFGGFAIGFEFYLHFPPGVAPSRFFYRLRPVVFCCSLAVTCWILILGWLDWKSDTGMELLNQHPALFDQAWNLISFFILILMASLACILIRNYRTVQEPEQKRKARWVIVGAITGTVPAIVHSFLFVFFHATGWVMDALFSISSIIVGVFPITLSYAVLKHRLLDIRLVLRRGMKYALAKNFFRVFWIGGLILILILNAKKTLLEILSLYFIPFIVITTILTTHGKRIATWFDRKFFREAYDQERILLSLIDSLKKMDSLAQITSLAFDQVSLALHPKNFCLFFREPGSKRLQLQHLSGAISSQGKDSQEAATRSSDRLEVPSGWKVTEVLEKLGKAADVASLDLPEQEKSWLQAMEAELVVPIVGTDERLAGFMVLGERKAEAPYTAEDRRLLEGVAGHLGIAYENALLKRKLSSEEKVRRHVLARVLEEGRNLVKECPVCGLCYDQAAEQCDKDAAELQHSLPVDRVIDGKYRLDRLIGRGGMGAVYEAEDLRLGRRVAVKIMLGAMFGETAALRRFEREARTCARLSHPQIITIFDFGGLAGEGAYLVMEFVHGVPMRETMRQQGAVPRPRAAIWFDQILDAIATAHREGVIHRDLKPENILLLPIENRIKILDFGLAKMKLPDAAETGSITVPGTILGTLCYMSPEQLSGQDIDQRSDIFSLGIMLVEVITGKRPFEGNTAPELISAILHREYHLPPGAVSLDSAIQRCIAKDRAQRFATATEMRDSLIPLLRSSD